MIDTHSHIDMLQNPEAEVEEAFKAGVKKIIIPGVEPATFDTITEYIDKYDCVYGTIGVHPSEAQKFNNETAKKMMLLAHHPKMVGIGEIGLDYHYENTDKAAQHRVLTEQLELVREVNLPAAFHVRDAYGDFFEVIKNYRDRLTAGAVMHCFSGSKETALVYAEMGFYISFSGSITFKNSKAGEIISALPLSQILIETDCPYLAPTPHRGELNYPKYVRFQAEKIAEVRGLKVEDVIKITTENAYRAFPKLK